MNLSDEEGETPKLDKLVAAVEKHEKTLDSLKEVPALLNALMTKMSGPRQKSIFDIPEDENGDSPDEGMQFLLQNVMKEKANDDQNSIGS
jgi:hypothetical protein